MSFMPCQESPSDLLDSCDYFRNRNGTIAAIALVQLLELRLQPGKLFLPFPTDQVPDDVAGRNKAAFLFAGLHPGGLVLRE